MTWLDLAGTQLTDEGLAQLNGLVNLQTLTLKNTGISDAGLFSKEPMTGSGDNPAEPDKRANLLPWLRSMQARHTTRRLARGQETSTESMLSDV